MSDPAISSALMPHALMPQECTFNAGDWSILARQWFPIAAASSVGAAPVAVTLLDVKLVIYRLEAGLRVAVDRCPHRGAPLSMGCVQGDEVICPYHGLHFGADGQCTQIPSQPEAKPTARFRLTTFPAVERYGLIWTCLSPAEEEPKIPPFPAWGRPDVQSILLPHVDIAAAPARQIEGFIDVAHFAWVHRATFADADNTVVPLFETRTTDYGFQSEYWSSVSNYAKGQRHQEPPGFRWLRLFDVFPPFAAMLTIHFPGDARLWILNLASPVSARRTRLFVPWARNFDIEGPVEDVYAFNAQVFAEDQAIVERQEPKDLPLESDAEPHFAADRSGVAYRRALKGMGLTFARPQTQAR